MARGNDDPLDALEQGIARIRQLAQQISEVREIVAANTQLLQRERQFGAAGPLGDARDLRTHDTQHRAEHAGARRARSRRRRR